MLFELKPGTLTLENIRLLLDETTTLQLSNDSIANISASEAVIQTVLANNQTVYGINTGFGLLASTRINHDELELLQQSIVLSHAAGTGELLSDQTVRLILLLKINSLGRGYSGVKLETIQALIRLFNARVYPCIPSQGSVGASGDLAPLAHMSALLLGEGSARFEGKILDPITALSLAGLRPMQLAPKEGLALLNGTQVSTALAMLGWLQAETSFMSGLIAGALSVDAMLGSSVPFDARIQAVRGHPSQIQVAAILRQLLANSAIRDSHHNCAKVQDPYSLRCQPQVMGACLAQLQSTRETLLIEANAVSDNPLIFAEDNVILSGGNFHAEPVAFAADNIALAIAEIGALSERRTALLVDPHFSQLPAFLVNNPGINSGFMIAQVTSAALASENKCLAHPSSVDSLPTSANQEDHVSMATYGARRLLQMADNTATIVGIELLAACQGIDFRRPLTSSPLLEQVHALVRSHVSYYDKDRFFAPDIAAIKHLVKSGTINSSIDLPYLPI